MDLLQSAHCFAYAIRQSVDAHLGLWTAAVIMGGIVCWALSKLPGYEKRAFNLYTGVYIAGVVSAGILLIMPAPEYCRVASRSPVHGQRVAAGPAHALAAMPAYIRVDPPGFAMDVPGFLTEENKTRDEWVYSDGRQSWLRIWPGGKAAEGGWDRLVKTHKEFRQHAKNDVAPWAEIETDTNITRQKPYFVLSWQSRDGTDNYESMCFERVDGKKVDAKGVDGKAYVRRLEILAPAHNNPFTGENYRHVLASFLLTCGIVDKHTVDSLVANSSALIPLASRYPSAGLNPTLAVSSAPNVRQRLGITGSTITQGRSGAFIQSVSAMSPAALAGLQPGDIIINFNNQRVDSLDDLDRYVGAAVPGSNVILTIWRASRITRLVLRL